MTLREPGAIPRVVQVGVDCVPSSGGTYTAMRDFCRALRAPVISVTALDLLSGVVPDPEAAGVLHVPTGSSPLARGYRTPSRTHPHRALAEEQMRNADLIIIHGLFRHPTGWAYRIARRQRIPYWVVPHGSLDPWVFTYRAARKRAWMALAGRRLVRDACLVIVGSPLEDLKAAQVLDPSVRRLVVPWAVRPHPGETNGRSRIREALGISASARVLLALGRLHPDKGIPELIRAVGAVVAPELHLLVVGPDSPNLSRGVCEKLAARSSPRIHVVGPAWGEERFAYFDAADGFISLSHSESFGYAVGEALAAGKPVIVGREAGITSLFTGSACGWILDRADEAAASVAIRSFLDSSGADIARLGAAGRAWVEAELRFERFEARLRDAVRRSIGADIDHEGS